MTDIMIPVINSQQAYPTPLTDRWGDYICRSVLADHWDVNEDSPAHQAYELLRGRYDCGEHDDQGNSLYAEFTPGDPRAFQYEEAGFVAFWYNQIGIFTEVELAAEFNDLDCSDFESGVDVGDEITRAQFDALVAKYSPTMLELAAAYPQTQFFIAHGDNVTYRGRVTLNAFTPLLNGRLPNGIYLAPQPLALMISPYFRKGPDAGEVNMTTCPAIQGITDKLIALA
ncbi:hypothetical protein [Marinobacter salicampi]|uniref:hypothetical protein n=1 Tax=Marinobacter salicampi TaxID=435907 RepID=UPI0014087293|nr:hypothetical protein [Marinobacter salicampi]